MGVFMLDSILMPSNQRGRGLRGSSEGSAVEDEEGVLRSESVGLTGSADIVVVVEELDLLGAVVEMVGVVAVEDTLVEVDDEVDVEVEVEAEVEAMLCVVGMVFEGFGNAVVEESAI